MGIGPSTKETSLHHFQDPLIDLLGKDPDIDFQGVIIVGTPQSNAMKYLVGQRTAIWLEGMRTNGVIATTDGWGNSDVDFANTLEEIGRRNISVIGLKFIGTQAKFVVENEFTKLVLDFNKSEKGIETEIVGANTIDQRDAAKALASIKLKMRKDNQEPR
ncbi:glycine/sarcosine/betaine reductase component B subunit (plasmid) [Enterococcus sp. 22-H-5-01]|uniref:glycine/sarcosine/betaine reductase component B subunit n=1 Tax=Enterococcus sp. 22-H-5-01 TaxID=3418555 RepID=UPI003D047F5D